VGEGVARRLLSFLGAARRGFSAAGSRATHGWGRRASGLATSWRAGQRAAGRLGANIGRLACTGSKGRRERADWGPLARERRGERRVWQRLGRNLGAAAARLGQGRRTANGPLGLG
jgi:hypothetical protein